MSVLRLLLLMAFATCTNYAFSQKGSSNIRVSQDECFEVEIKNKDYIIRIDTVDYKDGDDIFICKNTPYLLEVRKNDISKNPAIADSWDWTDCSCIDGNPQSFQATLTLAKKSSMKVEFVIAGKKEKIKLNFKIIDGLKININQSHNISTFAFDDHPKSAYPYFNKKVKSKFLVKDEIDNILLKSHKNYFKTESVSQNPTELSFISFYNKYMEFIEFGIEQEDSTVLSVCSDSILDLEVFPHLELDINLYRLAESDDDYANYCIDSNGIANPYLTSDCVTPIDSLDFPQVFECINPGLDGSLDLFAETKPFSSTKIGYWYQRRDFDLTGEYDKIEFNPLNKSTLTIYASKDTSGRYRCNSKPVTPPSQWNTDRNNDGVLDSKITSTVPLNLNIADTQNKLNSVYNKVGINFTIHDKGYDTLNYNISSFVDNTNGETPYLHILKFGGNEWIMPKAETITMWFIDELNTGTLIKQNKESRGRGTADKSKMGRNSCVISSYIHTHPTKFRERTVAHELGHGVFSLYHPDDKGGIKNDKLKSKVNSDEFNFMNSGLIINNWALKKNSEYRIRKYQWKKIRNNF